MIIDVLITVGPDIFLITITSVIMPSLGIRNVKVAYVAYSPEPRVVALHIAWFLAKTRAMRMRSARNKVCLGRINDYFMIIMYHYVFRRCNERQ